MREEECFPPWQQLGVVCNPVHLSLSLQQLNFSLSVSDAFENSALLLELPKGSSKCPARVKNLFPSFSSFLESPLPLNVMNPPITELMFLPRVLFALKQHYGDIVSDICYSAVLFHGDDEDAKQKHFPMSAVQSDDNILANEK